MPFEIEAELDVEIGRAVDVLRRGGIVAFPTETVYGLGANAEDETAVRRVFAAKGRPADHPLIVHLPGEETLDAWTEGPSKEAHALARRFWPGPLTLIVKRSARALDVVTGGLASVGLRVPSHPISRSLLARFGGAIAAPSANRFGHVSPTLARHVGDDLGAAVDLILDGGACPLGIESTIVDLSSGEPCILRLGAIEPEALSEAFGYAVSVRANAAVRSPGQLPAHYAPRAEVFLVNENELVDRTRALINDGRKVAVISDHAPEHLPVEAVLFPLFQSIEDFARGLYSALRETDRLGLDAAVVKLPPPQGIGLAITDRLERAAFGSHRRAR